MSVPYVQKSFSENCSLTKFINVVTECSNEYLTISRKPAGNNTDPLRIPSLVHHIRRRRGLSYTGLKSNSQFYKCVSWVPLSAA